MNDYKRIILVVLGALLIFPVGFLIKSAIDDAGDATARMYNTAIKATEQDRFNYAIDSHQGRLLAQGEFKPTDLVKFPEMTKGFGYIKKSKEKYTEHESCTTDEDGNESCDTYYTWDYAGSDELSTPEYLLHGRKYPASLFNVDIFAQRADACDFTEKGENVGWLRLVQNNTCADGYYYTDSDTRYDYRVINQDGFTAAFLADASTGKLKPTSGESVYLENKSIEQMIRDANSFRTTGMIFIVFWWVLMIGGACAIAYAWALGDGIWK